VRALPKQLREVTRPHVYRQDNKEGSNVTCPNPASIENKSLSDSVICQLNRWNLERWVPIPLRLIVGYGFIAHGYAKLVRGPEVFVGIVHAIGVPAPAVMAWATIVLELLCGIAVLIGAFVSLMSVPMAAILLVAIFTVHLPNGFSSIKLVAMTPDGAQFGPPGYECDLLYLACLAALVLGGAGPWSVDHLLGTGWWLRRSSYSAFR
jgi:putative oxidoreductase